MSRRLALGILVTAVIATGTMPAARAEEHLIRATAAWQGRARIFVTGPQQGFVLAAFGGRLAVEPGSSPLDGAQLLCPGALEADYAGNRQQGEGRCIITARNGDRLFARWMCAGEPDKGCAGRFVLTGGTGAFQGATGEGEIVLQLALSALTQLAQQESEYDLAGIARWPALKYRTP